jgi:CheY-like chemotaxis protein
MTWKGGNVRGNQETEPTTMKILIVDDDKKLCRLVADYLEPMGYAVEAAHNGSHRGWK